VARALGILLAGGRGRRLSATVPKALVSVGGRTLLDRALATLDALCDDVVVCAPGSLALPIDEARRVRDPEPGDGPLSGLVTAMRARTFERALVLGVDLPFAGPPALEALLALLGDAIAVAPAPGGIPQPLAAWYTSAALPGLAAALARGERALVPAVRALPARLVTGEALAALPGGEDAWFNLNTPDDLALAERRFAGKDAR
jgi:molybdenum cofactor guanylyltransferase